MLLFYLFLSIGVSFLCSLFEAVILSLSPAYVASVAEGNSRWGKSLANLKTKVDDSLAAILTLNTIAHTVGATGVGAEVLRIYGDQYVAIASAILTLLILFVSEIIPKTLGATYPRMFAPATTYGIRAFIYITYPFVFLCNIIARRIGSGSHIAAITREEVVYTAEIGKQEGTLSEDEALIIRNLLHLRQIQVNDVMTPRTVVFALDETLTIEEVLEKYPTLRFSRIPVYQNNIDHITGVVMRYDIVAEHTKGNGKKLLSDLKTDLFAVADTASISKALDFFVSRSEHIFSVYDEHGGFDGVLSLEDVIETLLGIEITDEFDSVEDLRVYAKMKWKQRLEKRKN